MGKKCIKKDVIPLKDVYISGSLSLLRQVFISLAIMVCWMRDHKRHKDCGEEAEMSICEEARHYRTSSICSFLRAFQVYLDSDLLYREHDEKLPNSIIGTKLKMSWQT